MAPRSMNTAMVVLKLQQRDASQARSTLLAMPGSDRERRRFSPRKKSLPETRQVLSLPARSPRAMLVAINDPRAPRRKLDYPILGGGDGGASIRALPAERPAAKSKPE